MTQIQESRAALPQPEPELTAEALMGRARALVPLLRDRQQICDELGRLPDETNDEFVRAGFYRILQPRLFGGYEFDLPTFARVMIEIARGCPSSGWVLALTAGHPLLVASMPVDGQAALYGDAGEFRAPLVGMPGGTATRTDGGYSVNAGWDYASGCDIATHFIGMAVVPGEMEGAIPRRVFVTLRRDQFEIIDNWDMMGMRGTGSRRVVVKDTFVPAAQTLDAALGAGGARPGLAAITNPMYAAPFLSVLIFELACVAVGIGRGALDEYESMMKTKTVLAPGFPKRFEQHEFQTYFGRGQALVDTAEAAVTRAGQLYMEWAREQADGGETFDDIRDRRLVMIEQQATALCGEAVEMMFRTMGTSAAKPSVQMGHYFRDMSVLRTHMAMQQERTAENFGRVSFGLEPIGPM